ncbi:MAG: zinc dependent phospholipase C family protein [Armatimonadota bacterium]
MTPLQHLLLAEQVRERLGWSLEFRPYLLMGAIAPDTHRVVDDISYRDLHFRSRSKEHNRLIDFLNTFLRRAINGSEHELSFWVGWLSHIVADDTWRHQLRERIPELWETAISDDEAAARQMRKLYRRECVHLDIVLFSERTDLMREIRTDLLAAEPRFCSPLIPTRDLHSWRLTVAQTMLPPLAESEEAPVYLDADFVDTCLYQAREEVCRIVDWETEDSDIAPIF